MGRTRSTYGTSRNAYRVLVGKPEGKRPLGRPRRRWDDNIKMKIRKWKEFVQQRHMWKEVVKEAKAHQGL